MLYVYVWKPGDIFGHHRRGKKMQTRSSGKAIFGAKEMKSIIILVGCWVAALMFSFIFQYPTTVDHVRDFEDAKTRWITGLANCHKMYDGACKFHSETLDWINDVLFWAYPRFILITLIDVVLASIIGLSIMVIKK